MIKKFEEFVNESLKFHFENYDPRKVFRSFGFEENVVSSLSSRIDYDIYSIEELTKILEIVTSVVDDTMYAAALLKVLFDEEYLVEEKQDILDKFCKKFNGDKPLPIVIGVNGKVLTGKVYYCEEFGIYMESEDDFEGERFMRGFEKWANEEADEEGILDDDRPDWIDRKWSNLNIKEVDLDKEFGWVEK
jgi:hypothetical protein